MCKFCVFIKVNSNDCKIVELYCWLLLTVDGNLASVTVKTKATGPIWFWDDNYLLKYRGWPVGAGYSGLNNKAIFVNSLLVLVSVMWESAPGREIDLWSDAVGGIGADCGAGVRLLHVKNIYTYNATFSLILFETWPLLPNPHARSECQCQWTRVLSVTVVSPWTHAMSCVVVLLGQSVVVVKCLQPGYRQLGQGSRLTAHIRFECNLWTLFGVKNLNI